MAKAGSKFGVAALGGWLAVLFVSLCLAWLPSTRQSTERWRS